MEKEKLLVNIEIPFCMGHCRFCRKKLYGNDKTLLHRYIKAVLQEVKETSQELAEYDVVSVHIGGGEPGILGTDGLADFLFACRQLIPSGKDCQWVIDMLPNELSAAMMTTLRNAHMDCINVGVMTTRMKEFPHLKRPYYLAAFDGAMSILTMYRQQGVGITLLTGIPEQTRESLAESVQYCLKCNPERFSFYPYAAGEDQTEYLSAVDSLLQEKGFLPYGDGSGEAICYGLPGREEKDMALPTKSVSVMGFGAGARTALVGMSYRNTADLQKYIRYAGDPEQTAEQICCL